MSELVFSPDSSSRHSLLGKGASQMSSFAGSLQSGGEVTPMGQRTKNLVILVVRAVREPPRE